MSVGADVYMYARTRVCLCVRVFMCDVYARTHVRF